MDIQKSARHVQELIRQRHQPEGHHHPSWWDYGYVGGSTLVGYTAFEIAEDMTADRNDAYEEDDVSPFYTYRGDTLHEGSHHPDDGWVHDVEGRVPIDYTFESANRDPFDVIIHPDSLSFHHGFVHVGEHKAYGHNHQAKQEKAYAQDILGSATLLWVVEQWFEEGDPLDWHPLVDTGFADPGSDDETKVVRFYETDYAEGGFQRNENVFTDWSASFDRDAIACHLTIVEDDPNWLDPDPFRDFEILPREDLHRVLDYYLEKARIICKAVDHEDPSLAYTEWDMEHPEEFAYDTSDPSTLFEPDQDLIQAAAMYEHYKDKASECYRKKKRWSKRAVTAFQEQGIEEVQGDFGKVELTSQRGSRNAKPTKVEDAREQLDKVIELVEDPDVQDELAEVREQLVNAVSRSKPSTYPTVSLDDKTLQEAIEEALDE